MHRNTYLLVLILAVFAALVVGVNVGRRFTTTPLPSQPSSPTPTQFEASSTTENGVFKSNDCGVSFSYPESLTVMPSASGSALFVDKNNPDQSVVATCQSEIPRPPIPGDKQEFLTITNAQGSVTASATLYHDASPKDGTPIDELIFLHPETGMDVYIAGFGETFDAIVKTLRLL